MEQGASYGVIVVFVDATAGASDFIEIEHLICQDYCVRQAVTHTICFAYCNPLVIKCIC